MDKTVVHKRKRLFRYAVNIFIELLEQVTKTKKNNVRCNDADVASFETFMDTFGDNVGEEFIRKFTEYGMQSWFNDGSERDYSKAVRFSWIFGKKAIERWNKCSIETNVFITRKGLKTRHKINVVRRESSLSKLLVTVRPAEEKSKGLYLNTKRGLVWCVANTTLYFHKSSACAMCENKIDCKDILKREYPKVYKTRGYHD